jgi:hypothetical protein
LVAGDEDDRAREKERAEFLIGIANDLQSSGALPSTSIILRLERVKLATHAYFILNDAYHRWRIEEGHFTQPPKIAALQSLCIMRVQPFRLAHPANATTIAEARSNEIFSLAAAGAILQVNVGTLTAARIDQWLRILDILSRVNCETIEQVIATVNMQIKRDRHDYSLSILEQDKPHIDVLITIFELLRDNAAIKAKKK